MVSAPGYWHRAPETLKFFSDKSIFCYNEVMLGEFLDSSQIGAGYHEDQAMIRSLDFSALPTPFSREGRRAVNGVNNWSCLHEEASIKSQEEWGLESSQVGEHIHIPGG